MIKQIRKFLCKIGIHRWDYEYRQDGKYQSYTRECKHCNKLEFMNMYPGGKRWFQKSEI